MNNNNVLEEFFVWEEKNLIDQSQNLLKNAEQDNSVTTTETKIDSMQKDWRDITDPKLRKKAYKKTYYEVNKDKIKVYQEANKDKIKLRNKAYRETNKDKAKAYDKDYRETNKERKKAYDKAYREANKDKVKIQKKAYYEVNKDKIKVQKKDWHQANKDKRRVHHNNLYKTDIQYKLIHNLRARLRSAINGNYKAGSAVRDLGCTIAELKVYLQSKFQPGMSWDNWALDGWHIDHIKPLSSFDLTDRNQFLEACHYTNLQPLWAQDNLSKSDKILSN